MGKRGSKNDKVTGAIDLGTSQYRFAVLGPDGQVQLVPDCDGLITGTPAIVGFDDNDSTKFIKGRAAENLRLAHPSWTSTDLKRVFGEDAGALIITSDQHGWSAEELLTRVVMEILQHAEQYLGKKVAGVLATVPACADTAYRKAITKVIQDAGYEVIGLITEPTAALLGYLLKGAPIGTYIVLDIGKGTSDCTVITAKEEGVFVVGASHGIIDVAGREMTLAIMPVCEQRMGFEGVLFNPEEHLRDAILLEQACNEAKHVLSTRESTYITWQHLGRVFDLEITRDRFNELTAELVNRIEQLLMETLTIAKLKPSDLNGIVLAGGGSRMPAISAMAERIFGEDRVFQNIDMDTAVVWGAAAGGIGNKVREILEHGGHVPDGVEDLILPTEPVVLKDAANRAWGVESFNTLKGENVFAVIVKEGTPLPVVDETRVFKLPDHRSTPDVDGLNVIIRVLEGDSFAPLEEATVLAEFSLKGLPLGDPDMDRIEIHISTDLMNAIGTVRAVDRLSGKEIAETVNFSRSGVEELQRSEV